MTMHYPPHTLAVTMQRIGTAGVAAFALVVMVLVLALPTASAQTQHQQVQQDGGPTGNPGKPSSPVRTAVVAGRAPVNAAASPLVGGTGAGSRHLAASRTNAKARPRQHNRLASQRDTLELDPINGFYDDFANSYQVPDTNRWRIGGGAFINNTWATRIPNFQVATLDGLNAKGNPYDTVRIGVSGRCDTLTSLPLDMTNVPIRQLDSIWLSFNYQVGGPFVQMMPEQFDSLLVQFKLAPDTNWVTKWFTLGDTTPVRGATTFRRASIKVGTEWLGYGFQFRFLNYGSRNGSGDIFSIDNVYMNYGRDSLDISGSRRRRDLAAATISNGPLFPYTALPYQHLNELAATGRANSLLADTVRAIFTTLNNYTAQAQEVPYSILATVVDSATGQQLIRQDDPFSFSSQFEGLGYFPFLRPFRAPEERVNVSLPRSSYADLGTWLNQPKANPTTLVTTFTLPDQDPQNNPYRRNDTISHRTRLASTYAYDDGTAELVRWTGGNNARMAQRFRIYKRDTLKAIQMLFPRTMQNTAPNRVIQFNLYAWPRLVPIRTNQPERFYVNISVTITPAANRDQYTTFPLLVPVIIDTGDFYIGWQQLSGVDNEVRVGVDINSEPGYNVFYNVFSNWEPDSTDKHPLCIRPVFPGTQGTTSLASQQQATLRSFPNPVSAGQSITFSRAVQRLRWRNSLGQLVLDMNLPEPSSQVVVPALAPGIYWVEGAKVVVR